MRIDSIRSAVGNLELEVEELSMGIFRKRLEFLEESDLLALVEEEVEEGLLLDYKSDWVDSKKLAKAVASFANTHGGHLILGVLADKERNIPSELPGLANQPGIKERVGAICRSRISPAPVFRMKLIPLSGEPTRWVLVVEVPESPQPPHYVNGVIYVRSGESSRPLEALRNYHLIEKLYEKRAHQEELVERLVSERQTAHRFKKADYSLTLLTCPSLPGRSPLPLYRRAFFRFSEKLWDYSGVRVEPRRVTLFNESRWQERVVLIGDEGLMEQAAGVCFPERSRERIQEEKLFGDLLPAALARAIAVYEHEMVQYYGSLRIRVLLHGARGRRLTMWSERGEELGETESGSERDPIICDRVATVPALSGAKGRREFVSGIVREVRRAFGQLVFEPDEAELQGLAELEV